LDDSKVSEEPRFQGLEIELHRFDGARVLRVVHPCEQNIAEHRHDQPYIGLYIVGHYRECYDGGEADMRGPSAVFHPAGRPHADVVHSAGLETLTIEFDPAWLRCHGAGFRFDRSLAWSGGAVGLAAQRLAARLARAAADEHAIGRATADFLTIALAAELDAVRMPHWVQRVCEWISEEDELSTRDAARRLDLHPAYLAHAYRHATGEGLGHTWRRRRVEQASAMLRRTDHSLAQVAAGAGFCDQSHMNRCFSAVLGRTPVSVRNERRLFDRRDSGAAG
jgi:AraC family transcriptional regulator